jgi:IS5 family transposase
LASATEETRRRRRRSSSNAKPGCKRDLSAMAIKRHHLSTQHATSFETPNNTKGKFILLKKKKTQTSKLLLQ